MASMGCLPMLRESLSSVAIALSALPRVRARYACLLLLDDCKPTEYAHQLFMWVQRQSYLSCYLVVMSQHCAVMRHFHAHVPLALLPAAHM